MYSSSLPAYSGGVKCAGEQREGAAHRMVDPRRRELLALGLQREAVARLDLDGGRAVGKERVEARAGEALELLERRLTGRAHGRVDAPARRRGSRRSVVPPSRAAYSCARSPANTACVCASTKPGQHAGALGVDDEGVVGRLRRRRAGRPPGRPRPRRRPSPPARPARCCRTSSRRLIVTSSDAFAQDEVGCQATVCRPPPAPRGRRCIAQPIPQLLRDPRELAARHGRASPPRSRAPGSGRARASARGARTIS